MEGLEDLQNKLNVDKYWTHRHMYVEGGNIPKISLLQHKNM